MATSHSDATGSVTARLDAAFEALAAYVPGSSRGALTPIDDAVRTGLASSQARGELEHRLIATLAGVQSAVAREYVCSQLVLMGSKRAVDALAAQLDSPEVATAARRALEAIPGARAAAALRNSLERLDGLRKIGVIHSLGERRDVASVNALGALLRDRDAEVVAAALAALGNIATRQAARLLDRYLSSASEAGQRAAADAMLTCAEHRLASGAHGDAEMLYRRLDVALQPSHVRAAAARGLKAAEVRR